MGTIKYLLDTHVFLWAVHKEGSKLSETARSIIEDADSQLFISAVSAFEITNKYRIGKLPEYEFVVEPYHDFLVRLDIRELPVTSRHAHHAGLFDWNHRDPFDRIIASQAYIDNLTLISNDPAFDTLPWVTVVW